MVQALHDWQRYFLECVSSQTPQALLDFNVFFDFRHVFGDEMLVFLLRDHIHRLSPTVTPSSSTLPNPLCVQAAHRILRLL